LNCHLSKLFGKYLSKPKNEFPSANYKFAYFFQSMFGSTYCYEGSMGTFDKQIAPNQWRDFDGAIGF